MYWRTLLQAIAERLRKPILIGKTWRKFQAVLSQYWSALILGLSFCVIIAKDKKSPSEGE
ncbi:MAG: hypothetical protein EA367_08650 [Leptolyngbya sp. DLM2.Bin15]|nr:MAG: hypothetical protein EA367_08650 [Leptolyngbya sp. DLM2.Bin15]